MPPMNSGNCATRSMNCSNVTSGTEPDHILWASSANVGSMSRAKGTIHYDGRDNIRLPTPERRKIVTDLQFV